MQWTAKRFAHGQLHQWKLKTLYIHRIKIFCFVLINYTDAIRVKIQDFKCILSSKFNVSKNTKMSIINIWKCGAFTKQSNSNLVRVLKFSLTNPYTYKIFVRILINIWDTNTIPESMQTCHWHYYEWPHPYWSSFHITHIWIWQVTSWQYQNKLWGMKFHYMLCSLMHHVYVCSVLIFAHKLSCIISCKP